MKFIRSLHEMATGAGAVGGGAVTGAHDIGAHGGHQTSADLTRNKKRRKNKKKNKSVGETNMIRREVPNSLFHGGVFNVSEEKTKSKESKIPANTDAGKVTFKNSLRMGLFEDEKTKFDPADVISKLNQAEKRADTDQDTVAFGLKDDEGNIVEVYVRADQAEEFEQSLAAMLSDDSSDDERLQAGRNDDEHQTDSMEIAEVLFKLQGRFEIVDVVWPNIEGDEQQEQTVSDDQEGAGGAAPVDSSGEGEGEEGEDEEDVEDEDEDKDEDEEDQLGGGEEEGLGAGGDSSESTLQQVIDLLKSQAEAQKAKAEAKAAEAEREEAKYAAQAAKAKVSQEEQILDMEAYNEKKKEKEDEAKRLAKLAKWKHEKANKAEESGIDMGDYAAEQQEEVDIDDDDDDDQDYINDDETVDPEWLANRIYTQLRQGSM